MHVPMLCEWLDILDCPCQAAQQNARAALPVLPCRLPQVHALICLPGLPSAVIAPAQQLCAAQLHLVQRGALRSPSQQSAMKAAPNMAQRAKYCLGQCQQVLVPLILAVVALRAHLATCLFCAVSVPIL